jgi:hypothetical protein
MIQFDKLKENLEEKHGFFSIIIIGHLLCKVIMSFFTKQQSSIFSILINHGLYKLLGILQNLDELNF